MADCWLRVRVCRRAGKLDTGLRVTAIAAALLLGACDASGGYSSTGGPHVEPLMAANAINVSQTTTPVSVNLSTVANVHALVNNGSPVSGGGMDGYGDAYSATLTGTSVNWAGTAFSLGAAGKADAISSLTLALPAGNYSTVLLLATGVHGNQPNQPFVVTYTDGTKTTIVQSVSDWFTPQNYPGESKALSMAYRLTATGATQTGPFYLYGYSLPINGAKPVQSLTLPNNRYVVVLAVVLSPATPAAANPTMTPQPGTYSTAQTVTLSDTTPGAAIYYTTNGTTPTTSSAKYSSPIPVSATTTIKAIAVASGYSNSDVATGTYTIAGTIPVSVNLSTVANVHALVNNGSPVSGGGMDGYGDAYSATLTGTSVNWAGTVFSLGAAGKADAISSLTLALPAGNYSTVLLLATGVHGNQPNQPFVVTYTDGTKTTIVQSVSDWFTPQNYPGESKALSMPYRLTATGATQTGPFYLYGYSLPINGAKPVQSLTLPNNHNVVVLAITLIPATSTSSACSPLTFGAAGDGTTDNTIAIQSAVNACAAQGGGIVELSVVGGKGIYLTGPFTLQSHVHLQIDSGVTLQATHDHSRFVAAYINWVYQPNEALIAASGATDTGIIGAGIIDGAGNQVDPDDNKTWWDFFAQESPTTNPSLRPWLLEFYQCDHVTISGVTLRNPPYWTQALRFSSAITESGVTISAPADSPNTDGVDLVGSSNVTLSNLNISVGDDNIAIKSGLPIKPSDPFYSREIGLPQMATSQVQVSNITAGAGHGISIGSEAVNGVNHITVQSVNYMFTGNGFRIKSARDRGGQISNIVVRDITMTGVGVPLSINAYYRAVGPAPSGPSQPITATTPYIHDITIQNVTATGATAQSYFTGLPESCIHNLTLSNVSVKTSGAGMRLEHVTGAFTDVTSSPPFVVLENVAVTASGTTPFIAPTPPLTGQTACDAQTVPPGS